LETDFSSHSRIENVWVFILAFLGVSVIGLLVLGLAGWILIEAAAWANEHVAWARPLGFYLGNLYLGCLVTWALFFLDGLITLTIAILVLPIRVIVILVREFVWKIANFPAGPITGFAVVTATVLEVVRAFLEK
jgi:hypothetical protein